MSMPLVHLPLQNCKSTFSSNLGKIKKNRKKIYILLRRLKVALLSFFDIFLVDNGPLANSSQKWLIPQTQFKIATFGCLIGICIYILFIYV
jgi:hypothetical protein